ncbi:MAG: bifunctional hydroxymethylpyrimidine kinase/phosphomethylpyrimidine kinase [Acidobacteria bacterium]|nr:MAG: bifunctional hydroxymethylpyrimidine kinase/phosphomethylpyrimidine kinase [Acidobacteriota bacterium]
MKRALTIAGSDSGGGAGIQADLKTFGALGVFGMSAITAVTAQNTVAVTRIQKISPDVVAAQIDAVADDIGVDAAKTGMLWSAAIIEAVAAAVKRHRIPNLVVDPVIVSKSGARLLKENAIATLTSRLLPLAAMVTPNLPEAQTLAGMAVPDAEAMREAARRLHALGPRCVVIKGGHAEGPNVVDLFYDGKDFQELKAERVETRSTHGTGCTFSAAIAAYLAHGLTPLDAVSRAKPLNHFHAPRPT